MRQFRDAWRQALNVARDKGAVDELAQAGVSGRLQLQQRMPLDGVKLRQMLGIFGPAELRPAGDMQDLAAKALVAQDLADVGVIGKTPKAILLPVKHWRFGADGGVGGIGILIKFRVARIKIDAAAHGVDFQDRRGACTHLVCVP